jgi:hypothetical protein
MGKQAAIIEVYKLLLTFSPNQLDRIIPLRIFVLVCRSYSNVRTPLAKFNECNFLNKKISMNATVNKVEMNLRRKVSTVLYR